MSDTAAAPRQVAGKIGVTALVLYLLAIAIRIDGCYAPDGQLRNERASGPAVGATFPSFEMRDVSGATISLADLSGTPAILAFVPSLDWSPPTKARLIDLAEAFRGRRDVRVAIVTTADQATARARAFVRDRSTPFYYLIDDVGLTQRLGLATEGPHGGAAAVSATFVLDAAGTVRFRDVREPSDQWLDPRAILDAVARVG